jgi:hypothetical protein
MGMSGQLDTVPSYPLQNVLQVPTIWEALFDFHSHADHGSKGKRCQ